MNSRLNQGFDTVVYPLFCVIMWGYATVLRRLFINLIQHNYEPENYYWTTTMPSDLCVAIDAEWVANDPVAHRAICVPLVFSNGLKFIVTDPHFLNPELESEISTICDELNTSLVIHPLTDDFCPITHCLKLIENSEGNVYEKLNVLLFFSPRDINHAFGFDNIQKFYLDGTIEQDRRLKGKFTVGDSSFRLTDLKGWTNSSLAALARSVSIPVETKSSMDEYKTKMDVGLQNNPRDFIQYALGDCEMLFDIHDRFIESMRWVQGEVLGLPEADLFTGETIPKTTGSIVAAIIEQYLNNLLPQSPDLLQFCYNKLGLLEDEPIFGKGKGKGKGKKESVRETYERACKVVKDLPSFYSLRESDPDTYSLMVEKSNSSKFKYRAYSQNSVGYYASFDKSSCVFNALVQGGRCNNERYEEDAFDNVLDADLNSAYASVLRRSSHYLGLPTITAYSPNQSSITIGQWLKKNKNRSAGNWQLVFSGSLSFHQDLFYSKLVKAENINKAAATGFGDKDITDTDRDDDQSHIPGDFALLRKEIVNGILTERSLEVLKHTANNLEYKEFMELSVVCAAYYEESNRCDSIEEWCETVLADRGKFDCQSKTGRVVDTRTRKWFPVPLEPLFGKTTDLRNEMKKQVKNNPEGSAERDSFHSRSEALKLFNNTGYGVLASPFFNIGNTITANNITCAVRMDVWMMAKALNGIQTITDGCAYNPAGVFTFTPKAKFNPSLEALSTPYKLIEHRSITRKPLGGRDWSSIFQSPSMVNDIKDYDQLALEHCRVFWSRYELNMICSIAHKEEHCATRWATFSKGDYAYLPIGSDEIKYKIRGTKEFKGEDGLKRHPKYDILDSSIKDVEYVIKSPEDLIYNHLTILKSKKYAHMQKSQGYQDYKDIRPGENMVEDRTASFNNLHIPVDTAHEFLSRTKRPKPIFERVLINGGNAKKMFSMMNQDRLDRNR